MLSAGFSMVCNPHRPSFRGPVREHWSDSYVPVKVVSSLINRGNSEGRHAGDVPGSDTRCQLSSLYMPGREPVLSCLQSFPAHLRRQLSQGLLLEMWEAKVDSLCSRYHPKYTCPRMSLHPRRSHHHRIKTDSRSLAPPRVLTPVYVLCDRHEAFQESRPQSTTSWLDH